MHTIGNSTTVIIAIVTFGLSWPCSLWGQPIVDSIVTGERLYLYPGLDYHLSPYYQQLATLAPSELAPLLDHDNDLVRLYSHDISMRRAGDTSMICPTATAELADYISKVSAVEPEIIIGDVSYTGNPIQQVVLSQLMTGDTAWSCVTHHYHPLLLGYAGRSMIRMQRYELLDSFLPQILQLPTYIHQLEGCQQEHTLVADYVLSGPSRPGTPQVIKQRYRDLLLYTDNQLIYTAEILSGMDADSTLQPRLLEILSSDLLPIPAMLPILRARDSTSTAVVTRLYELVTTAQIPRRHYPYIEQVFAAADQHTLANSEMADIRGLHLYLLQQRDRRIRRLIAVPFYRWLHRSGQGAYQPYLDAALRHGQCTSDELTAPAPTTYKITFR